MSRKSKTAQRRSSKASRDEMDSIFDFPSLNVETPVLFTADNLYILKGLSDECVDFFCTDPPFNSRQEFAAPLGSDAEGSGFDDKTWSWPDVDMEALFALNDTHPNLVDYIFGVKNSPRKGADSDAAYLASLSIRFVEMHRVLKVTGSICVHCDPPVSHHLRVLLDNIFGAENFLNEIAWCYPPTGQAPDGFFPRKHDVILFYAKKKGAHHYKQLYTPMTEVTKAGFTSDRDGRLRKKVHGKIVYLDESKGRAVPSWWDDCGSGSHMTKEEKTHYPTQKPRALLDRFICALTRPGDVVCDPYCGSGTTLVAAQLRDRKWIGIEKSPNAVKVIKRRFHREVKPLFDDFNKSTTPPAYIKGGTPMSPEKAKPQLFKEIMGEDDSLAPCVGCKQRFEMSALQVDHIWPVAHGGKDFFENYQLLCITCNRIKGDRTMEFLWRRVAERRAEEFELLKSVNV